MQEELETDLVPISEDEIFARLNDFSGWEYKNNKITKTIEFANFSDGLYFLSCLALFCDKIDHHPDVSISNREFRFELTRYSIGGKVTERDFSVVKKIEQIYRELFEGA